MTRHYRYCGLQLESDLALPELPAAPDASMPADLRIVRGAVPPSLATAVRRTETYEIGCGEALWRLDGVARYRVCGAGRRIEVEPAALADAASVRLFLLQPVFALASVLRGDYALSAAAVERDGQVTALVGPSASGKSVAAGVLLGRGWRLVSDSLLRVTADGQGRMLAHPQAPGLNLWPDAIKQLGLESAAGEALRPGIALRRLDIPMTEQPLPLTRVAVLRERQDDDSSPFDADPFRGARAFELVLHHVAGATWTETLAARQALFRWATSVSRQARVERVAIPWGWDRTDALGEWLEGAGMDRPPSL